MVLIDQADGFVFGFSKLDVMFGRATADAVRHSYRDLVRPGVQFVHATVQSIDPSTKHVETSAGAFDADILVVALGADLHPEATPGLVEHGHEFYTVAGAFALRDVLANFEGGNVIVAVCSTPFKCPPAPSETALLTHDFLVDRDLRDRSTISLVMPLPVPIPPSPDASKALLAAFEERDIAMAPAEAGARARRGARRPPGRRRAVGFARRTPPPCSPKSRAAIAAQPLRSCANPAACSDRGLHLGVDLHARAHRRRRRDALEVPALGRRRLGRAGSRRAPRRSSATRLSTGKLTLPIGTCTLP